jgi:hypothetical protein
MMALKWQHLPIDVSRSTGSKAPNSVVRHVAATIPFRGYGEWAAVKSSSSCFAARKSGASKPSVKRS